jgi:hypothetical protein
MSDSNVLRLQAMVAGAAMVIISGCAADINYLYDVPSQASECPSDTLYRSGGTGIRDRSGGTNIRDRNGDDVKIYCEAQLCPDGVTVPTGEPFMVWHLDDHQRVIARGICPAI